MKTQCRLSGKEHKRIEAREGAAQGETWILYRNSVALVKGKGLEEKG